VTDWARHGECNGCGACCQAEGLVRIIHPVASGEDLEYMRVRGYRFDLVPGMACAAATTALPCPQHDALAGRCRIYDRRPLTCREFPIHPGQVEGFGRCSYWFESPLGERRGGPGSPYPTPVRFVPVPGEAVAALGVLEVDEEEEVAECPRS